MSASKIIPKLKKLLLTKREVTAQDLPATPAQQVKVLTPVSRMRRFLISGSALTLGFKILYESEDHHDRQ